MVVRPGYQSAFHRPANFEQAQGACKKGDTCHHHINDADVDKHVCLVGSLEEADQRRMSFTCPQPECSVVGSVPFYFATLEQWQPT